ncbi:DUF1679 domain-containing protein [bacterium CPR1]|nr:DUF1679 domain-containing protein [bacterium CPR1]
MTAFDPVGWVLARTGARAVTETRRLQSLWGGYGQLLRLHLEGGSVPSVILKQVIPPADVHESVADRRKRRSYAVEQAWYLDGARRCDSECRVARCYAAESSLLLLEDLQNAGFHPDRPPLAEQVRAGLHWLAYFHARFLGSPPPGLWEQGSYWHLQTRREEWLRMPRSSLKDAAEALDDLLRGARFQTLLHGDSKPANFCWNNRGQASAVDFQYVGPGCGIRDTAYFLDCCLGESGCESQADHWLDHYFTVLRQAIEQQGHSVDLDALEREWRSLFPVAWSDFCRFEQGWRGPSPMGPFSQRQLVRALELIKFRLR